MPVYKLVQLPSGKKVRLPKGASNRGGRTLYWAVENVDDQHLTYQAALAQLQAIKASQRRRALGITKHPLIERTEPSRKKIHSQMETLIDTSSGRPRIISISEYSRRSKLGKKHTVSEHTRRLKPRARKVVLRQNTFSPETEMVFRPVVDEEIRRIARAQPEGRMRPEELKSYFSFRQKVIPPAAVPGRLTEEEMHQLGYTRPSLIEYLRWDRELDDFVVDNRLVHPNQPVQLIKGVDTEVANSLNEMNIYTVADYERAVRLFIDQNPDAVSLAEARRKNIDERKRNLMRMWNQLTPKAQTEIFNRLDELSKLDPETVPEGFALRETEIMVSEAFLKQKAAEEAEARRLAEPRITKVGRPKKEKTIKELTADRLKIMTNPRLTRGEKNRKAGRISRTISRKKYTNKLVKLINHIETQEGKGHFSELERFVVANKAVEKPTKRAINPFKKEALEQGQITIGNVSYQPRSIDKKRPKHEPIESMVNDPANNIDTYIFIDKEPARPFVASGRKARVYDPLYRENENPFFLNNKQINFSRIKWKGGERFVRPGGRTYYSKDDINTVLASIEDPHVPYVPARHVGEDKETRNLPYVIMGGHGQPLVFVTKKGYFAIKPTKIITDEPTKRALVGGGE